MAGILGILATTPEAVDVKTVPDAAVKMTLLSGTRFDACSTLCNKV
jgi:hypothetical protein